MQAYSESCLHVWTLSVLGTDPTYLRDVDSEMLRTACLGILLHEALRYDLPSPAPAAGIKKGFGAIIIDSSVHYYAVGSTSSNTR